MVVAPNHTWLHAFLLLGSVRLGEVRSSGGIFDPFVYRGTGGQGLPPMMTQDGLKTRWGIMKSHLKSGMCAGVIQASSLLIRQKDLVAIGSVAVGAAAVKLEARGRSPRGETWKGSANNTLQMFEDIRTARFSVGITTQSLLRVSIFLFPSRRVYVRNDRTAAETRPGVSRLQIPSRGQHGVQRFHRRAQRRRLAGAGGADDGGDVREFEGVKV